MSKIESNKKIYKILDNELKNYIHSLQILISLNSLNKNFLTFFL